MESSSHYDVIIVGLGCVGLSAAYYLSKQGFKVLGLEQYPDSGSLGSSSFGHTRIWRLAHPGQTKYKYMQEEALEIWHEAESFSGKKLLEQTGFLMIMDNEEELKFIRDNYEGEALTMAEIKKRYPALGKLPDTWGGFFDNNAGLVRSREALDVFKQLCQTQFEKKAELKYNSKVTKIDAKEGFVIANIDGAEKKITADKIVVSTGIHTQKFFSEGSKLKVDTHPMETFMFSDQTGLPPAFIILHHLDGIEEEMFGLVDGNDLQYYKFGNELGSVRSHDVIAFLHKYFPEKMPHFMNVQACFYQMTEGHEFIFQAEDKAIFACGFNGKGFKHMPYHGKRIYNLVVGNVEEANKYK